MRHNRNVILTLLLALTLPGCIRPGQWSPPAERLDNAKTSLEVARDMLPNLGVLLDAEVAQGRVAPETAVRLREIGTQAHAMIESALNVIDGIEDPSDANEVLLEAIAEGLRTVEASLVAVPEESASLREKLALLSLGLRVALRIAG